jgi:S1-C subfamily serine protease
MLMVLPLLLAGAIAQASPASGTVRCEANEGAPVAAPFGVTVCSGAARATPITHDEPQPGARVVSLDPEGVFTRAGLVAGDVIYQVNGESVKSGKEATEALRKPLKAAGLSINFWRNRAAYLLRVWSD